MLLLLLLLIASCWGFWLLWDSWRSLPVTCGNLGEKRQSCWYFQSLEETSPHSELASTHLIHPYPRVVNRGDNSRSHLGKDGTDWYGWTEITSVILTRWRLNFEVPWLVLQSVSCRMWRCGPLKSGEWWLRSMHQRWESMVVEIADYTLRWNQDKTVSEEPSDWLRGPWGN